METIKGFTDYTGEEAQKREAIRKIIVATFEKYGFEPAETPVIEDENFVKGDNEKDEAVSDVYKLEDKGKRKLALRYEFTFQLKRIAKNKKLPYKRYQIGPVFRDEPISSNRFRQFISCDLDVVGSSLHDEAEVLSIAKELLEKLGIKAVIYINNRKLLNEILDKQGIKNKEQVIKEIDKLDKLSEKEIKNNLKKFGGDKVLEILKKPESYFKKYSSYKEIEKLKKYCRLFNVGIKFMPSLARGLSYYDGTIFEIKSKQNQEILINSSKLGQVKGIKETIFGGGAYTFNNVPSFGFGVSIERLSAVSEIKEIANPVLIISINKDKEAVKLAKDLRSKGISCSLYYGKPGKALEYANSKKLQYAVFVGDKEVKSKKFTLKDLKSGKESKLGVSELVKKLSCL